MNTNKRLDITSKHAWFCLNGCQNSLSDFYKLFNFNFTIPKLSEVWKT